MSSEAGDTVPEAAATAAMAAPPAPASDSGEVEGSCALRPVFLGNLLSSYTAEDVTAVFERPQQPQSLSNNSNNDNNNDNNGTTGETETLYTPIPVDRVDLKRGYCFVFLKDAATLQDKRNAERFVTHMNGMQATNVSSSIRAEFARGDGRVKRKEDERRKNIAPSETLFVVNFHQETTKKEDLQMLFEPFGELERIDMKRNYAFVQFRTIAEATKAKETTNGGKLDQSVLTVEYVARQRNGEGGGDRGDRGGDRDRGRDRGGDRDRGRRRNSRDRGGRDRDRYDDRRNNNNHRGPPPPGYGNNNNNNSNNNDRYSGDNRNRGDHRRDDRYDDYRGRDRSPGWRPRSRSRSRSPPPQRYGSGSRSSRSPPMQGGRDARGYDDNNNNNNGNNSNNNGNNNSRDRAGYDNNNNSRDRGSRDRRGGSPGRDRSPPGRDSYRGDRDRGYRAG